MSRTLYEKIGGFGTVSNIVLNFYGKVLESEAIAPYFAAVDMPRLIDHQTQFVCSLLGGPASFSDDQIRSVHRPVAISQEAFDHAVALFEESLKEAQFEPADIETAVKLFEGKRALVVSV
jgi:hemoglobin